MPSVVAQFLNSLFAPGDVFEIRAPKCVDNPAKPYRSTRSGYFTFEAIEAAADAIATLDALGVAPGIYTTMNPANPSLLGRAINEIKSNVTTATADADIVVRRHLLIDCDPVRPADISATETELVLAAAKTEEILAFLTAAGWPLPIRVMSGNGHHLIYRINLPGNDGGLVQRVLEGLAIRFDDENVKIDRSVSNAARIIKIPGTMAKKGGDLRGVPGIADRPHRRAELLSIPDKMIAVATDALEAIAATAPQQPTTPRSSPAVRPTPAFGSYARFDHTPSGVRAYLEAHGVTVVKERTKGDSTMLDLARCPVSGVEANGTEISVMVTSGGSIAYRNLHNRGEGIEWIDIRENLEPGYRAHVETAKAAAGAQPPQPASPTVEVSEPWDGPDRLQPKAHPFPLDAAFPKQLTVIKEYVSAVSESLQVPPDVPAMLMQPVIGLGMSQVCCVQLNDSWRQSPVHYNAVLMEPANRKSDPLRELLEPVYAFEQEAATRLAPLIADQQIDIQTIRRRIERLIDLASGKSTPRQGSGEPSGEAAKKAAKELQRELDRTHILTAPQLVTGDTTPEALASILCSNRERVGIFSDESETVDIMLGRYSDQPNFQLYNKGYDGSTHRINRATRPPIVLKRPLLSIGFAIQPESVRDLLANRKAKGTGMIARYALSLPDTWLGRRKMNPARVSPALRDQWHKLVRTLIAQRIPEDGSLHVIPLSPEARAVFDDFRAHIEAELTWCGEFTAHGYQDWGGKLCGKIGRIALTLHGMLYGTGAIDSLVTPISLETMLAALEWAPYLIAHTKAVMSFIGFDDDFVTARRVLAWIARTNKDRFTANDCFTHVRNNVVTRADQITPALDLLLLHRFIRLIPSPQRKGPGRPGSAEYMVNPLWDRGSP